MAFLNHASTHNIELSVISAEDKVRRMLVMNSSAMNILFLQMTSRHTFLCCIQVDDRVFLHLLD